jgi:hypothetical protein
VHLRKTVLENQPRVENIEIQPSLAGSTLSKVKLNQGFQKVKEKNLNFLRKGTGKMEELEKAKNQVQTLK